MIIVFVAFIVCLWPVESQKDHNKEISYQWEPKEEDGPINVEGSHLSLQILNNTKRKKKVNTGITRIFRQHKFLEFRHLNVYDENRNSNFDFWYLFLFYEVVAESKITLWIDIRIIGIVCKLKPDILKAHCQSIHGPIERNYNFFF